MAGINLLAALKKSRGAALVDYEWGSSKILQNVDIEKLSRSHLRQHLEARDLATDGTKRQMTDRLKASLEGERLEAIAYSEQLESEFDMNKDIEERGCVYGVGSNHGGQLAQGDTEARHVFSAVVKTRGVGVVEVATNGDTLCFALTADHEVMVWGGGGTGATGIVEDDTDHYLAQLRGDGITFVEPQFVFELTGEEAVGVAAGASHVVSVTQGGDIFCWGHNLCGQLGLGDFRTRLAPELLPYFEQDPELSVARVDCGEAHSAALTQAGQVYTWGHVDSGRLGLGVDERLGARKRDRFYFPAPTLVSKLAGFVIRQVACGAMHTLALAPDRVFAWGHGAGGRLGLGDCGNRIEPASIPDLENRCVLEVCAATWTSGCVVLVPPLVDTGWVHTWGSGYQGQLGLGDTQLQLRPAVVQSLVDRHLSAKSMRLGSHHSSMVAMNGELYTWGSNIHCCLGHAIRERFVEYTAEPGHVSGFGTLVDRIGRGMVRSIALGREFTLVATYPYQGPGEDVARDLMEEEAIRRDEVALEAEERLLLVEHHDHRYHTQPGHSDGGGGGGGGGGDALFNDDSISFDNRTNRSARSAASSSGLSPARDSANRDVAKMLTKGMTTTKGRT